MELTRNQKLFLCITASKKIIKKDELMKELNKYEEIRNERPLTEDEIEKSIMNMLKISTLIQKIQALKEILKEAKRCSECNCMFSSSISCECEKNKNK